VVFACGFRAREFYILFVAYTLSTGGGEGVEIEAEIAALQAQLGELSKKRTRREVDAAQYNNESCDIMNKLDGLFTEREGILEQRGVALLDKAVQELFTQFMSAAREQEAFDKDVFARLVKSVKVFGKDNIVFELRNGIEIKGDTTEAVAA